MEQQAEHIERRKLKRIRKQAVGVRDERRCRIGKIIHREGDDELPSRGVGTWRSWSREPKPRERC